VVEQLEKDYKGKVKIVAADVGQAEETAASLGIASIPCVVFYKGGQEVSRIVGAYPKQRFVDEIKAQFGI
jgi:thioredoxin 1